MPERGVSHLGRSGDAAPHNSIPVQAPEQRPKGIVDAIREWALCAPELGARRRVRLSHDRGRNFPRKLERDLNASAPSVPAAVYVYEVDGTTRLLAADFDTARAVRAGASDPGALVRADGRDFAALITSCGGTGFDDISPNGGRHAYILWSAPIPFEEMRRVALALAKRYPTLDPKPMLGRTDGLIRPPGSVHKSGGYQMLACTAQHARHCLDHPNGPRVWAKLLDALAPELEALEAEQRDVDAAADHGGQWPDLRDEDGSPWLPRPNGPLPRLSPRLEHIAKTGQWDPARYGSPSEARQAVITGALACGWQRSHVTARIRSGDWPGLASFYARYGSDRVRVERLAADWAKAEKWLRGERSSRKDDTSRGSHTGGSRPVSIDRVFTVDLRGESPVSSAGEAAEFAHIRAWWSSVKAAQGRRWTGRRGITVALVLRALVAAAQMTHCSVIGWGCRSLALLAGMDEGTVADVLRELREEIDPFIDHVREAQGAHADWYRLRIPDSYAEAAAWRRWQPGRLGGVHPVFRELGGPAALIYEQLTSEPTRRGELPLLTGVSDTATSTALRTLAEHGMAERHPEGWVRGPADPTNVARQLDIPERIAEIQARYRRERTQWRMLLMLAEMGYSVLSDAYVHPVPLQDIADAGVPEWVPDEATGPPVSAYS